MNEYKKIAKFNPRISTQNLGDFIIEDYCNQALAEMFEDYMPYDVPTHEHLSKSTCRQVASSDLIFVLGTNILSSNMRKVKQWNINLVDAYKICLGDVRKRDLVSPGSIIKKYKKPQIVLMGAGWHDYQELPTPYTKRLLKVLLSDQYIHSVRDSYSESMLKKAGFNNIINTACPTMWKLTEEWCSRIPSHKASKVITTITDYRKDEENDRKLLDILCKEYEEVILWLQSIADLKYLEILGFRTRVKLISPTLAAYDRVLKEEKSIDYIGTRLHGGIRALNMGKRTCIISIDNRAAEIAKDTNLSVIQRERIDNELSCWIEEEQETNIHLPWENIKRWKSQFV